MISKELLHTDFGLFSLDRDEALTNNSLHAIYFSEAFQHQTIQYFYSTDTGNRGSVLTCPIYDLSSEVDLLGNEYALNGGPIVFKSGESIVGWVESARLFAELLNQEQQKRKDIEYKYNDHFIETEALVKEAFDVVYVTDGEGRTLHVSQFSKEIWGLSEEEIVGKSIFDLERQKIFNPSVTRLVLENKKKMTVLQTTITNRRLLAVGIPIKDETGKIVRIVNGSRDVTEVQKLHEEIDDLRMLIKRYKEQLEETSVVQFGDIIHRSKEMERVISQSLKVADVDSTVLITGDSGVGKEAVAKLIYSSSSRSKHPFIKINCGSIPESLIESELFGYEKGAFTGALKEGKMGLIEAANHGTLFLDEIGDLPLLQQVKLLRVLQEGEITRIGGTKVLRINVRTIAATNKNLYAEVKKGTFREDLFYRLNVIPIHIPPLRERPEDIVPIAMHYLNVLNDKFNNNKSFSNEVIDRLLQFSWEGNIRELKNIVERIFVMSEHSIIEAKDLPANFQQQDVSKDVDTDPDPIEVRAIIPLKKAKDLVEEKLILLASQKCKNLTEISEMLQVNQSTVSRIAKKMKK